MIYSKTPPKRVNIGIGTFPKETEESINSRADPNLRKKTS